MVTHSMKQALEVGSRTVMLHQGQVVFDIAGKDREGLEVKDLLGLFEQQRGLEVDDDSLRSEEHTSELQSRPHLVCRLLLEKKKKKIKQNKHKCIMICPILSTK